MKFRPMLAVVLALFVSAGTWADDIADQIGRGLRAYNAAGYADAIQELQFAVAQIQEKLNAGYLALMPEPLSGWQADPAEAQTAVALMGGGTHISRHYHNDSAQEVTLEIAINSPLIQNLNLMLSNTAVFSSDRSIKPYRFDVYRGVLRKEGTTREISVLVGNRVMVKATGQDLKDEKPLEAYLKTMDLKKVATAIGD
ncbi:conserved exported hypothetical protein [Gammaproteobacteria bacterium]